MGRSPCCEKMGLKKGPWSPEEDRILINFIQNHGHSNWRALPKQAGLLRCGKSCRLRWTNYLRPDIKRGNFTIEEEDAIIKLHDLLGNRWSAIAAKLPGRTDNEIKNVWHTHLKKRIESIKFKTTDQPKSRNKRKIQSKPNDYYSDSMNVNNNDDNNNSNHQNLDDGNFGYSSSMSTSSSSEFSSSVTEAEFNNFTAEEMEGVPPIDDSFWSETTTTEAADVNGMADENNLNGGELGESESGLKKMEFPVISMDMVESNGQNFDDDMEFWYDVFIKAGGISELPEF